MSFIYFLIHSFLRCKEKDLEWFKDKQATCKKCGRTYINWQRYS